MPAVAMVEDSPYGLQAGVFTRDLMRGHRMAAGFQAGPPKGVGNVKLGQVIAPGAGFATLEEVGGQELQMGPERCGRHLHFRVAGSYRRGAGGRFRQQE